MMGIEIKSFIRKLYNNTPESEHCNWRRCDIFLFQSFDEYTQIWLYIANIGILISIVAVFYMLEKRGVFIEIPGCLFLNMTNLPCPACGGTRAFFAFLNGHIWQSFCYNPVVLYGATVSGLFLISQTVHLFTPRFPSMELRPIHFLGVPVILLGQWVIRLIVLFLRF